MSALKSSRAIRKIILITNKPENKVAQNICHLGATLPIKKEGRSVLEGDPFIPTYLGLVDSSPHTLHFYYVFLLERATVK